VSTTTTADVDAYAARVRTALADLPGPDRDDLLAELEDHLSEVADEGPLEELLGAPEAYAAELRSSAGLPAGAGPRRWQGLTDQPWLRPTLDFLPELRPGWWVLRGVLLAWISSLWFFGAGLPGTALLTVLLVPVSVVLGRRSAAEPRLRWAGLAASVTIVVLALILADAVLTGGTDPQPYPVQDSSGLDGVSNLYPYDKDGRPLSNVQLFDQDGNPVELRGDTDRAGNVVTRIPRTAADGLVVGNVYPQRQSTEQYELDGTVRHREVTPPSVNAPKLSAG
jgi:hypothetical protein